MTDGEKNIVINIIKTLGDPVGNWPWAWERLCELAELDRDQYNPPFKPHPFYDPALNPSSPSASTVSSPPDDSIQIAVAPPTNRA
jgi:hypothetical protein